MSVTLIAAIYLLFLLALVPYAAYRNARAFRALTNSSLAEAQAMPSRSRIFTNSILMLALMFALAWFTARSFGYRIFDIPQLRARELAAGGAALCMTIAISVASALLRTPDEIRTMPVNRLMPQSAPERAIFSVAAIAAGIAEEAAYRGVLMQILWHMLGNPWAAAGITALAFAVGHVIQGWKSTIAVFALACLMQALVWFTGTLVIAMAVHAVYDLLAPTIRRTLLRGLSTAPEKNAG